MEASGRLFLPTRGRRAGSFGGEIGESGIGRRGKGFFLL